MVVGLESGVACNECGDEVKKGQAQIGSQACERDERATGFDVADVGDRDC